MTALRSRPGWSDIHNQADYQAEHSGGSLSSGGPVGKDLLTNLVGGMLSGANNSGHAEGTTKAAISEGTLIVRDTDQQRQDISTLNRDTDHANDGSISPIFNKEKEQNRLKQAQLVGEIGGQAMDVIRTQGDIAGLKAQKDPDALSLARDQLTKDGKPVSDADVMQRAYNNAMLQYGTGSDLQKAAQAVTGALTALAGNNLAGALASGASPYLATEIKKLTTTGGQVNVAANAMAHAVLGAVTAQLNNQSAVAGGLGAGGGELAARYIADRLFPGKTPQQLNESEKQQVSALATLAAGLAGGLATGDAGGAVTGAQSGKNAVENNSLANGEAGMVDMLSCSLGMSSACERAYPTPEQHFTALGINAAIVGGYQIIAATPEMLALAKAGMEGCKSAPIICMNNVGLQLGEAVIPGGSGAGGALVVGRTAQEIAAVKNARQSLPSVDKLSQAASSANRNGLTDAGRSLQKHSGRLDSVYSVTDNKSSTLNSEAQFIVDDILTNPGTKFEAKKVFENKVEISVIEAKAPDGRMLRFNEHGTRFIGFREPPAPKK